MTLSDLERIARDEYERIESDDALSVLSVVIDLIDWLKTKEIEDCK